MIGWPREKGKFVEISGRREIMTETEVKTKKTFKFKGKELSRYEYIKVPVYLPIQVTIMIYTPNKGFFSSICHEILKKKG